MSISSAAEKPHPRTTPTRSNSADEMEKQAAMSDDDAIT